MAKLNRRETRYVSVLVVHIPDVMALIDMLRYDRCCPTSEDETQKIYRLLGERRGGKDASPLDHVIRLHRFAAENTPATSARWESYGCHILDERSPDVEQLSDADILQLAAKAIAR